MAISQLDGPARLSGLFNPVSHKIADLIASHVVGHDDLSFRSWKALGNILRVPERQAIQSFHLSRRRNISRSFDIAATRDAPTADQVYRVRIDLTATPESPRISLSVPQVEGACQR